MAVKQQVRRLDGSWSLAEYSRHVRTLSYGGRESDVDVFRLTDGAEIECISPSVDCRVMPEEIDQAAPAYPGYPAGV
jgi:hypothetical protein